MTQNIKKVTVTGVKTMILTQLEEQDVFIILWVTHPAFWRGKSWSGFLAKGVQTGS